MSTDYNSESRLRNIMKESKSEAIVRSTKEEQELFSRHLIDPQKLADEINIHQSLYSQPYITNGINTSDDIRTMSTYNAMRYLYRKEYDIRSCGKIDYNNPDVVLGRELNPRTNIEMPINYYNDFSISLMFDYNNECSYRDMIIDIYPRNCFIFSNENSKYKNIINTRKDTFFKLESKTKKTGSTHDFFSNNRQVNPLLYTYCYYDENNIAHPLDSDYFLESNWYMRKNDHYTMKGNQSSIPIWIPITDCSYEYLKDEDDNITGVKYNNPYWLFDDEYTHNFYTMLQTSYNYFNIEYTGKYSERESKNLTEDEIRGFLVYDLLLDIVKERMIRNIENDPNKPENSLNRIETLFTFFKQNRVFGEIQDMRIDQYLTLDSFPMYNTQLEKSSLLIVSRITII